MSKLPKVVPEHWELWEVKVLYLNKTLLNVENVKRHSVNLLLVSTLWVDGTPTGYLS